MNRQLDDTEATQRALLIIKTYDIPQPVRVGAPLRLDCTIVNAGATAAMDVAISRGVGGGDTGPWTVRNRKLGNRFDVPVLVS